MTALQTDNPNADSTLLVAAKPIVQTSTKPPKSVGVQGTRINKALIKAQNPPSITKEELSKIAKERPIDSFSITYKDREYNEARVFNFSLPPAIDNILVYSASGPFRGNASVPDVKAGLPIRTTMKHKNIVIPGGTNVIQTIGIESKYIVLVGAFFGTEEFSLQPKTPAGKSGSYVMAKAFDERVVQQGAPVTLKIVINLGETIEITGVVVDFKTLAVRFDKSYYSITILYTKYPKIKLKEAKSEDTNQGESNTNSGDTNQGESNTNSGDTNQGESNTQSEDNTTNSGN